MQGNFARELQLQEHLMEQPRQGIVALGPSLKRRQAKSGQALQ